MSLTGQKLSEIFSILSDVKPKKKQVDHSMYRCVGCFRLWRIRRRHTHSLTVGHMSPFAGQLPGGSPGKLQHGPRDMQPPSRLAITLASLLPALGTLSSWRQRCWWVMTGLVRFSNCRERFVQRYRIPTPTYYGMPPWNKKVEREGRTCGVSPPQFCVAHQGS